MNHGKPEIEEARYQVSSRRQIISLLSTMMEENHELSIQLVDRDDAIRTSILCMEENAVLIKAAADPVLNKAIVESQNVIFAANPPTALIRFAVKQVHSAQVGEQFPALKIDIPEQLLRIQRREFFRIPVPATAPLRCKISFTSPEGHFNLVWASVNNISAGGICIADLSASIPLALDTIYNDCRLELDKDTVIPIRLRTRSVQNQQEGARSLGCAFIETPRAVLASIQKFILQLEREQNTQKIK